jgi:hypothetical protein
MEREIPNSLLSVQHLPGRRAPWREIEEFALTFNGYGYFLGFDGCAEQAARTRKLHQAGLLELASTSELRNLLFFTQRAVRHVGDGPGDDDTRMGHDVVEVLRDRLLVSPPPVDSTPDELDARLESTPLPAHWFGAMLDGLVDEQGLIGPLLCRVSPEVTVVACAAQGLLRILHVTSSWEVRIEAGYSATATSPAGRTDLVVRAAAHDDPRPEWVFEWKPLWERGFKENIGGIKKDLGKVRRHPLGCALVFAYEVSKAPKPFEKSITRERLELTVHRAIEALGPPMRQSRGVQLRGQELEAEFRLLAWR